jgi:hypothetical protein
MISIQLVYVSQLLTLQSNWIYSLKEDGDSKHNKEINHLTIQMENRHDE